MEVAVEVVCVWFQQKENVTETKLRKNALRNVTLTLLKMKRSHGKLNTRTTPIIHTKGKQLEC